jgi:hypothetical protein
MRAKLRQAPSFFHPSRNLAASSFSACSDAAPGGGLAVEDEAKRTKDAVGIFLFSLNPFARGQRLGVGMQGQATENQVMENTDATQINQV